MFNITPNDIMGEQMPLVTYKDPEDFILKGTHCRVKMDETIEDAYSKILEATKLDCEFELFELCQDSRNRYCRILRCFSSLKDIKKKVDGKEVEEDPEILTLK